MIRLAGIDIGRYICADWQLCKLIFAFHCYQEVQNFQSDQSKDDVSS